MGYFRRIICNFSCTRLTIIRNLKQNIGATLYKQLSGKINRPIKRIHTENKNNILSNEEIKQELE